MKKNSNHIVNKVNLEINTPNKEKAFELKNKIDSFLKDRLFPELELLFNEISSPDQIRRFETVQLEFEMQHAEDLDFLAVRFTNQLKTKLSAIDNQYLSDNTNAAARDYSNQIVQNSSLQTNENQVSEFSDKSEVSHYNNLKSTFIYFLETGRLPWYAVPELLEEFAEPIHFEEALSDPAFLAHLKKLFESRPETLARFVKQFSAETIDILIASLLQQKGKTKALNSKIGNPELQSFIYELIIAKLIDSSPELDTEKWERLQSAIKSFFKTKLEQNQFERRIEELFFEVGFSKHDFEKWKNLKQASTIKNKTEEGQTTDNKDIYIRNAGLILAYPFLKELLKRANCLNNQNRMRKEKQDYAVYLLHFLCTGHEMSIEHELTFEKFLCGLPFNQSVIRNIELREEDKIECVDLLKSIIENWTALKNTSPGGLRQNFFQRNGKLDLNQSPVKLYVERNTIDILLEKLPWSVSVVKLPWMNDLIFVEW